MIHEFLKKTVAIVVIYNEGINDSATLNSLEKGLDENDVLDLIIYDNSKIPQETKNVKFQKFNITYVHNPKNPGVSLAYNYGAKLAQELNKQWLLILDQDTSFSPNFFIEMNQAVRENDQIKLFAPILKLPNDIVLSPCSFRFFHGKHLSNPPLGINKLSENQPVNSGILVSLDTFFQAGGYNINVKLDYSDHQFIERLKSFIGQYYVIPSIAQQDFSGLERDLQKVLIRFKFYCNGACNFETNRFYHQFFLHFFLGLKLIKNSIKYKSLGFFQVYFKEITNSQKG